MNQDYWVRGWKNGWKPDVSCKEQRLGANPLLYFDHLALKDGDVLLVPLCGNSQDLLWCANQNVTTVGVELSDIACQQFLNSNNKIYTSHLINEFTHYQSDTIHLFCGDFLKFKTNDLGKVKGIYDTRALTALPKKIRAHYAKKIISISQPGCRVLLNVFESMRCQSKAN